MLANGQASAMDVEAGDAVHHCLGYDVGGYMRLHRGEIRHRFACCVGQHHGPGDERAFTQEPVYDEAALGNEDASPPDELSIRDVAEVVQARI
jgi:hypothetical protein